MVSEKPGDSIEVRRMQEPLLEPGKENQKEQQGGNCMIGIIVFTVIFALVCWSVDSLVEKWNIEDDNAHPGL